MPTATRISETPAGSVDPSLQFPENAALVLKEWAAKAGEDWTAAVNTALDKIKDVLGHPDLLYQRASDWAPGASGLLNDAAHGLGSARDNVKMYWEGQAFDAFDSYTTQVVQTSRDAAKALADLSKAMSDIGGLIIDTYVKMIQLLSKAANDVLEATSGVAGMIGDAVTPLAAIAAAVSGACGILQAFNTAVTEAATAALEQMKRLKDAVAAIAANASLLVLPDPIPAGVSISDNWDVHSAK